MTLADLSKPFIIADIGSNWKRYETDEKNLSLALRHISDAALCGVDAVKFQFFTHLELYGIEGPDSHSLKLDWLPVLAAACADNGVWFLCSAFSAEGVVKVDPWVNLHKVASCEMKHTKLLDAVVKTDKPFLVSTGAAHDQEINWLRDTYLKKSIERKKALFLECVAAYPAREGDYCLRSDFGLSDHTHGTTLALCALGMGAQVFEKHFDALKDFDRIKPSPDTQVSSGPRDLRDYARCLKEAWGALQQKRKHARESENDIVTRHRRRLKVTKRIKRGDQLQYGVNFGAFRSITIDTRAAGPEMLEHFEGKTVKCDLNPQDGLWLDDIE